MRAGWLPFLVRVFVLGALLALAPACQRESSDEGAVTDSDAERLRAFFEGSRPIPGLAERDELRDAFARTAVRASGLQRAGADIDSDEGWSPVAYQAGPRTTPIDARAWQESGDIDAAGSFVPRREACARSAAIDVADLPDEVALPSAPINHDGSPGAPGSAPVSPGPRAERLACALDRLIGEELRVVWVPGQLRGVIVDSAQETAFVNPRLIALIEPDGTPREPVAGGVPGMASPGGGKPGSGAKDDAPGAEPLDVDDNSHHPRPTRTSTNNDSGRTFCDKVCDDVWNDACDCNSSPGATSNDCDCGGSPGSSSSGCSFGACRCSHAQRGAQDTTGVSVSAIVAGAALLRRRAKRSAILRGIVFFCALLGLLAWTARAFAGPPGAAPKLVDVRVTVTPAEAAVFLDGNAVTPNAGIVRVPAGHHTFSAQLEGYSQATQEVDVPEKGAGTLVTLRLTPDKGFLIINGSNPQLMLDIDGKPVGQGAFSGLVTPGRHIVTATQPGGGGSRSFIVDSVAGQSFTVSTDAPATYFPPPPPKPEPVKPPPDKTPPKPRVPPTRGPYVLGNLSLLWQSSRPYAFEHSDFPGPGFAIGARAGYRIDNVLGIEGQIEYGRIQNGGYVLQTYDIDQNGDGNVSGGEAATYKGPGDYTLESLRLGPVLRFMYGSKVHRFLGGVGAGAIYEAITLNHDDLIWSFGNQQYVKMGRYTHHYEGWTPYLLLEAGYERSFGAFLGDIVFQMSIESVSGIAEEPYNSSVQARVGLALRAGWSRW